MADFTRDICCCYIAVLTLLEAIGCAIFLWAQSKATLATHDDADGKAETTGHSWDEGLTELNTPMPRWWMWLFYITIVFSLAYLFLYPGLGAFAGKFGWQSAGAYQQELNQAETEYGPLFNKFLGQDL